MQIQTSPTTEKPTHSHPFLAIDNVSKVYTTAKGPYSVIENVSLTVNEGEFICIIGHSGCGKSTLLNMVAGFLQPSSGEVRLQNQRITKPGPDRMMVFQNYSLLPWKTAFENVYLAVKSAYPQKSHAQKVEIVSQHLAMVGLTEAANKRPNQLSGGMKQRVAIARALAIRPQILILDEPFGALDAITREELQEELLQIWAEYQVTVLTITHDIDEALFLADKLVMMTNGPAAKIGEVLEIPFPRPRVRSRIMEDPRYYELRNYALDFLFRRFAHTEDPTATEEEKPLTAKAGIPRNTLLGFAATVSVILGGAMFYALSHQGRVSQTSTQTTVSAPSQPVVSPAPSIAAPPTVAASEITDSAKLDELNQKLYAQIDENWQISPTFTENLIYRVKVNSDGAIASYESVNQTANDYLAETPFPTLVKSANTGSQKAPQQPFAHFQVVLTPAGELQIAPVKTQ